VPPLVDETGRLLGGPVEIGLRHLLSRPAQHELAAEVAAQFARFAATELPLSHVDGHWHMHLHPAVFHVLLPQAKEFGASGLRLPRDDLWPALRHDPRRAGTKVAWALVFGLLCRWGRRQVCTGGLVVANRVNGLMQSGRIGEPYVLELLRRLQVPVAELYFHPSTGPAREPLANPGDLATLLSPALREVSQQRGLRLASYPDLRKP
jgi:predicted glycoside hydrolase/deacetylase ChbG (UPF0249 family)